MVTVVMLMVMEMEMDERKYSSIVQHEGGEEKPGQKVAAGLDRHRTGTAVGATALQTRDSTLWCLVFCLSGASAASATISGG